MRWYRALSLAGPWTFVASTALPASFKQIPPKGTPASVILASVAGTPQAQEAVIANSIPQTASVLRVNGPTFTPVFDGAPTYRPIAGTSLQYVVNARIPVIVVNPASFYAVEAGVWFTAPGLTSPWVVATSVPRTLSDSVETTARSQPPLIPSASVGLSAFSVSTLNTV